MLCAKLSRIARENPSHLLVMIDKSACPEWEKMNKWTSKSNKERLESHLQKLTEHLGGISFTYKVFED